MKFLKILDENLERWLMVLFLTGITLVLGIQIVFRFILNNSLTWSEELARFMFIWMAFLSIAFCLKEDISLKIDTLTAMFPKKTQAILLLIVDLFTALFFLYLIPSAWNFAYASVLNGQISAACAIPMYLVQGSILIGFILAAFRVTQNAWKNIRILMKKGEE